MNSCSYKDSAVPSHFFFCFFFPQEKKSHCLWWGLVVKYVKSIECKCSFELFSFVHKQKENLSKVMLIITTYSVI